jgi:hypothetical protein
MNPADNALAPLFEVRFASLFKPGSGFAFPCDGLGHVDLDALTERARNNYLFARATVGRDTSTPRVCPLKPA